MSRGAPKITMEGKKNQIGVRVKQRRMELHLTQDGLCACLAGITAGWSDTQWIADEQEIQKIEYGTRTVTTIELVALARALECSTSWLLFGEERERNAS